MCFFLFDCWTSLLEINRCHTQPLHHHSILEHLDCMFFLHNNDERFRGHHRDGMENGMEMYHSIPQLPPKFLVHVLRPFDLPDCE